MKSVLFAAAAALSLTATASAAEVYFEPTRVAIDNGENDIGLGIGLTWSFGGAQAKPGVGIGIKAFSQRRTDSFAGSVGVDYHFADHSLRPNLGVAYLAKDGYVDVNYGYNLSHQSWGFGFGAGYAHTVKDEVAIIYPEFH